MPVLHDGKMGLSKVSARIKSLYNVCCPMPLTNFRPLQARTVANTAGHRRCLVVDLLQRQRVMSIADEPCFSALQCDLCVTSAWLPPTCSSIEVDIEATDGYFAYKEPLC